MATVARLQAIIEADAVRFNREVTRAQRTIESMERAIKAADVQAKAIGDGFDANSAKAKALRRAIESLARQGFDENSEALQRLSQEYRQVVQQMEEAERAAKEMAEREREAAREADRLEREMRDLERETQRADQQMRELASTLTRRLMAALAALRLADMARDAVNAGLELNNLAQTAAIGFETMLGSAEAAEQFMRDLRRFAAETPFEFEGLIRSAQMMLAFGTAADDVLPRLRAVGDAAAAIGAGAEGIDRVTRALGQMQAKGVVSAEEMLQLAEAGIPAWEILAEKIGVDIPEAMNLVSRRAVSASEGIAMLVEGINERFGGMMERQARTVEGMRARIVDEFQQAAAEGVEPLFKALERNMSWVIQNMPFFAEAIKIGLGGISEAAAEALDAIRSVVEFIQGVILELEPLARWLMDHRWLSENAVFILPTGTFRPIEFAEFVVRMADAIRAAGEETQSEAAVAGRAAGAAFTGAFVEEAAQGASEAFQQWQREVEQIERALDLVTRKTVVYRENTIQAVDQPAWIRMTEWERVFALQNQLQAQEQIIEATLRALSSEELLVEEVEELTYQLERAQAEATRLRHELHDAQDALRLAEYSQQFEEINHLAELYSLQLAAGVRPIEELAARADQLLQRTLALNDGTVTYLRTLSRVQSLVEQIQKARPAGPQLVEPAGLQPPEVLSVETRITADLERLRLRAEAGFVTIEEAVARVVELRAQLIRWITTSGSLANATNEQIQLFNLLTSEIERLNSLLEQTPDRLQEILDALDRARGVGMAVESEIARATGADFDPIAYEMGILERAIREMYEATGEITPEMERLMRDLRALGREHQALALEEAVVRTALDSVGEGLGNIGRVLASSIRFEAGRGLAGFSFDPTAFLMGALSTGIGLFFQAISGLDETSSALERAAQALEQASRGWRETIAQAQFHELLTATPQTIIDELRRARSEAQAEIDALERRWLQIWNAAARSARIRELEDMIRQIDREIAELESTSASTIEARMEEVLGITTRSLQSAVSGAFSAATAEEFGQSIESALRDRVRNAFVTAFLESAAMSEMFEHLGDRIREALLDIDISPDEMQGIRDLMAEIRQRSEPLYTLLDQMGLLAETTERVNESFGTLRNVPSILKYALIRGQVATPIPLAMGGIVTQPTLALLGERGPEAVVPLDRAGRGMGQTVIQVDVQVQGDVYGIDDLDRRITTSVRRAIEAGRMATFGVT